MGIGIVAVKVLPSTSLFDADALTQWAGRHYSLGEPTVGWLHQAGVNDTYFLTAGDAPLVLRVYRHGWRTRPEIDAELRALSFVSRRGVRVAAPLRADNGQLVTELDAPEGIRFAVLFERAPGAHVFGPPLLAQCRAYGRLAAELHSACDAMRRRVRRFDIDLSHLLDEPIRALEPILTNRPDTLAFVNEMAERIRPKIRALPIADGALGLCHGDLHFGNAMFDDTGAPTLIDFDCCGYGWRAYDLAVFRWSLRGSKSSQSRRWNQFLSGYQQSRTLPDRLDEAVPLFLVARTIWLMGFQAEVMPERYGLSRFNDPYFDHWVGLMRGWIAEYGVLRG